MCMSPSVDQIAVALSKAQAAFPTIPKDSEARVPMKSGGSYAFKFASLPSIIENVKKILGENDLSFAQIITESEMTTLLMHKSGQWLKSTVSLVRAPEARMQDYGAQITYLRRYVLTALLGICADEDTDAPAFESQESIVASKKVALMNPEMAQAIRAQLAIIQDPALESHILQTASKKYPHLSILRIEEIPDADGKFINTTLAQRIEADDKARRPGRPA